jgi:acetyl-CoA acetyltransferase
VSGIGGQFAIVGIGETPVGKLPGRTALSLRLEASVAAMRDAGIEKQEIDGIITTQMRSNPQPNYSALLAERLGIMPAYVTDISLGGAAAASMIVNAAATIASGLCSTVLCVSGDSRSSARAQSQSRQRSISEAEDLRNLFGAGAAPIQYALAARRHMYEYGTSSRQFGAVAVACRRHAVLNPAAQMRKPITIEDHQNSKMIADPFRLLDCSLISDGAAALIVTRADRARDCRQPPVDILGTGYSCEHSEIVSSRSMTMTAARGAARQAFASAGISPQDVDVAELYDCFTAVVLVTLEDYGFCKKGEGGGFVEGGRIELEGALPVNTHGGLLSHAHIGGISHLIEAVTQLRHQAGFRQVNHARVAVASGQCGEMGIHVTLLFGNLLN